MALRTGLRQTFDESGIGYHTVGELYAQVEDLDTRSAALETANPTVVTCAATAGGGTTGLIPATATYVLVTSDGATKAVTLPTAAVGKQIKLYLGGATNVRVMTAASSNIKINNVDADSGAATALVVAGTLAVFTKVSTTEWVTSAVDNVGAAATIVVN